MTKRTRPYQRRALTAIAIGQLLALSLWFSASAASQQLVEVWNLTPGQQAGLTLAVQVGFVIGALVSAFLNIADVIASRNLFMAAAAAAAISNLGLLTLGPGDGDLALVLRFLTGLFLAGVYPSGLKVMAGWFREGRGMALGVLVGALTLGSASPHLVRGLGLDWRGVVVAASVSAFLGVLMMSRVGDGPFEVPTQPFRWTQVRHVVTNRGVRLATYGYLGHMWELYAMWTWMAAFVAVSGDEFGNSYPDPSLVAFVVIGVGGVGSWVAGRMADRMGRSVVAGGAMAISGSCALLMPALFGANPGILIPVLLVWGTTVVADSAQFSTMVTETADDSIRGTALTLQTALGFLLTLVTIRLVPVIADSHTWKWAFPVLAIGPAFGVLAMISLKRSPFAQSLAGGRG